jgi:hypothetical protein
MDRSRVSERGKLGVCRYWSHDTGVPAPGLPTQVRSEQLYVMAGSPRETLLVYIGSKWTRPSLISQTRKVVGDWSGEAKMEDRDRDTGAITCVTWHGTTAQIEGCY